MQHLGITSAPQQLPSMATESLCIRILNPMRQELADLGTVTSAEQLRASATAAAARGMRYPVRMGAFAFELLMAFLKGARLLVPLGTINEHVNLQARGAPSQGPCKT